MTSWNAIEWIVFVFAFLWAVTNHIHLLKYYRGDNGGHVAANMIALFQILALAFNLILPFSPLHFIWLFPLSYISPFLFIAIPFLRKIAWIYGYPIAWLSRLSLTSTDTQNDSIRQNIVEPMPPTLDTNNQNVDRILIALKARSESDLVSSEFGTFLMSYYSEKHSREFGKIGYMLRKAEQDVFGSKKLILNSSILEIFSNIHHNKSQERIKALTEYFDRHNSIGLGDPVQPFLFAPLDVMIKAFNTVVCAYLADDADDVQFEIVGRMVAFGYEYKVAEEIVTETQC